MRYRKTYLQIAASWIADDLTKYPTCILCCKEGVCTTVLSVSAWQWHLNKSKRIDCRVGTAKVLSGAN